MDPVPVGGDAAGESERGKFGRSWPAGRRDRRRGPGRVAAKNAAETFGRPSSRCLSEGGVTVTTMTPRTGHYPFAQVTDARAAAAAERSVRLDRVLLPPRGLTSVGPDEELIRHEIPQAWNRQKPGESVDRFRFFSQPVISPHLHNTESRPLEERDDVFSTEPTHVRFIVQAAIPARPTSPKEDIPECVVVTDIRQTDDDVTVGCEVTLN